jgi:4-amino-4-deoxy-L-arabinose transferase-like glycosyltransferase
MPGRGARLDLALATALSLLTVASRLPYRTRMLYNWDAVQFALALREYDVAKHQPHPPGYILYVALGRLVNSWLEDPASAYVALAVVFSGLTTFVVYFLALEAYDRASALTAASLLAVSPLFWFYGSVGLTYAGEALCASTVAYFSLRALRGSHTDALIAAGYLGLAGGLRQSILLLLFPLWLGATAWGVRRLRTIGLGLAIAAATVLTWFVPMIWLTGGLDRYVAASLQLADSVVKPTSVLAGPVETTVRMSRYVLESVLVGLGPLSLAAALLPWYLRRHGWTDREWFLVVWTVPPVLCYTLVHFGQAGYVLTFLPALVIPLSHVLIAGLRETVAVRHPGLRAAVAAGVVVIVVLATGSFFVNARPMPRDFDAPRHGWIKIAQDDAFDWIFSRTAAALREHEAVVDTFVSAIRGLYSPHETAVVTELGNRRSYPWLRHAMFYLPEYPIFEVQVGSLPPGFYAPHLAQAMMRVPDAEIRLPSTVQRLVWFVDHWSPGSERPPGLQEIELPHGRYLYVLPLARSRVDYAGYAFLRDEPVPKLLARRGRAHR